MIIRSLEDRDDKQLIVLWQYTFLPNFISLCQMIKNKIIIRTGKCPEKRLMSWSHKDHDDILDL